jgi:hypothetical protein
MNSLRHAGQPVVMAAATIVALELLSMAAGRPISIAAAVALGIAALLLRGRYNAGM